MRQETAALRAVNWKGIGELSGQVVESSGFRIGYCGCREQGRVLRGPNKDTRTEESFLLPPPCPVQVHFTELCTPTINVTALD